MRERNKKRIRAICPRCKTENKDDVKHSTEMWKVVSSTCETCGERMVIEPYYSMFKDKHVS